MTLVFHCGRIHLRIWARLSWSRGGMLGSSDVVVQNGHGTKETEMSPFTIPAVRFEAGIDPSE